MNVLFSRSKDYESNRNKIFRDEKLFCLDEIAPRTVKVGRRRPSQRHQENLSRLPFTISATGVDTGGARKL